MFRFFKTNLLPQHIAKRAAPISEQLKAVGIQQADIEACSNRGAGLSARAASSLLQDWVLLAHRRPIHSSNKSPEFSVSQRQWTDEECAVISQTLQLRDWDSTKSVKMNFVGGPKTIPRQQQQKPNEVEMMEEKKSVLEDKQQHASTTISSTTTEQVQQQKLKPRVVVRQSRQQPKQSNNEQQTAATATETVVVGQEETTAETTTSTTARRRVVRVGTAAR
jgi:hypothetical protein